MTEFTFKPTQSDPESLNQYLALFENCFPDSSLFTPDYLSWLYADNPQGEVVGVDAWDGDTLAATYVCVPTRLSIKGQDRTGMLSLNTATHSDYRGQGLFTRLAQKTYELGREREIEIVYGVANANSIGGFIRKLGFQDVGGLNARIGLGHAFPKTGFDAMANLDFRRLWTAEDLSWRMKNPSAELSARPMKKGVKVWGKTHRPLIGSTAFLPHNFIDGGITKETGAGGSSPFNVTLALVPDGNFRGLNMELPQKLRPSPLRLIFRDLTDDDAQISADKTYLSFIDFDAF